MPKQAKGLSKSFAETLKYFDTWGIVALRRTYVHSVCAYNTTNSKYFMRIPVSMTILMTNKFTTSMLPKKKQYNEHNTMQC